MKTASAKQVVEKLLELADVQIGGPRAWDIRVTSPQFFEDLLVGGSLALGECYMDDRWHCNALDQLFDRVLRVRLDKKVRKDPRLIIAFLQSVLTNVQRRSQAFVIGKRHYDIGNRLFAFMLDKGMNYSCAFWDKAETLDEAQENKLDLICRKIELQRGHRVLDIGCGWGGFAKWAAEKYGARVHGITVSRQQAQYAQDTCRHVDVTIDLQDYRSLKGTYDRIVSIGMFEHVGYRNYRRYFKVVRRCLAPDGLFLMQTIGGNTSTTFTDPWISKYIFPNSMLPSPRQISAASEGVLVIEDWHNLGPHYDRTLMSWYDNFIRSWDRIKADYDQRFFRMWTYYLLSCAGSFRARRNHLWQIVFSRTGVRGGLTYRRFAGT